MSTCHPSPSPTNNLTNILNIFFSVVSQITRHLSVNVYRDTGLENLDCTFSQIAIATVRKKTTDLFSTLRDERWSQCLKGNTCLLIIFWFVLMFIGLPLGFNVVADWCMCCFKSQRQTLTHLMSQTPQTAASFSIIIQLRPKPWHQHQTPQSPAVSV